MTNPNPKPETAPVHIDPAVSPETAAAKVAPTSGKPESATVETPKS